MHDNTVATLLLDGVNLESEARCFASLSLVSASLAQLGEALLRSDQHSDAEQPSH